MKNRRLFLAQTATWSAILGTIYYFRNLLLAKSGIPTLVIFEVFFPDGKTIQDYEQDKSKFLVKSDEFNFILTSMTSFGLIKDVKTVEKKSAVRTYMLFSSKESYHCYNKLLKSTVKPFRKKPFLDLGYVRKDRYVFLNKGVKKIPCEEFIKRVENELVLVDKPHYV